MDVVTAINTVPTTGHLTLTLALSPTLTLTPAQIRHQHRAHLKLEP